MTVQTAPYGTWKSPITTDLIVAETVSLSETQIVGDDIFWIEMRPAEKGRYVIVRRTPDGATRDVTPAPFNARTRVHEYGGGGYLATADAVYFSNFADQRMYRIERNGGEPRAITPEAALRYADPVCDALRNRIICVREDHREPGKEPVNAIVSLDATGRGEQIVVASGHDFYSTPRLSPDGRRLAWLAWNHPNMPWDGTELWVAELNADGSAGDAICVAGTEKESIFQPEWSAEGDLVFISDRSDWWNLYRWRGGEIEALTDLDAEFGRPAWVFATGTYGFESPGRIVCSYTKEGVWSLASLNLKEEKLEPIAVPHTTISHLRVGKGFAVFVGGSPDRSAEVAKVDLKTGAAETLRRSSKIEIDEGYLSKAEAIEFPTEHGRTSHAFFYAPRNKDFRAPEGEKPPVVVFSHGGPTTQVSNTLNPSIQFWTSRGFAIVDVNYGGSTGYGREYRERLKGNWGIVDVDDCVNAVTYLAKRGAVDADRAAIRGGSAGGYTTLAALAFRKAFKAGASYFGLSDLEAFVKETHKFESRYLDALIGPYPERRDLYIERSPIHHADRISCPIILLQGLEDKVVPPNQATMMFDSLKRRGLPVAYVPYEGEQHGFRMARNIKHSLESELYFYSRVFGFELADKVDPVSIENMD